jgi:hypothetical protein
VDALLAHGGARDAARHLRGEKTTRARAGVSRGAPAAAAQPRRSPGRRSARRRAARRGAASPPRPAAAGKRSWWVPWHSHRPQAARPAGMGPRARRGQARHTGPPRPRAAPPPHRLPPPASRCRTEGRGPAAAKAADARGHGGCPLLRVVWVWRVSPAARGWDGASLDNGGRADARRGLGLATSPPVVLPARDADDRGVLGRARRALAPTAFPSSPVPAPAALSPPPTPSSPGPPRPTPLWGRAALRAGRRARVRRPAARRTAHRAATTPARAPARPRPRRRQQRRALRSARRTPCEAPVPRRPPVPPFAPAAAR